MTRHLYISAIWTVLYIAFLSLVWCALIGLRAWREGVR